MRVMQPSSSSIQEKEARHTAALALAKVAAIELPGQQWPDLVSLLLGNMSVQPPDSGLRQSTLQALGYICEEMGAINDDVLSQQEINSVLTAVVQVGLRSWHAPHMYVYAEYGQDAAMHAAHQRVGASNRGSNVHSGFCFDPVVFPCQSTVSKWRRPQTSSPLVSESRAWKTGAWVEVLIASTGMVILGVSLVGAGYAEK